LPRRGAIRFKLRVTPPADIDALSLAALKALVAQLLVELAEQKRLTAELREENARLKGLKGRPRIKSSGMEEASEAKRSGKPSKRRGRGKPMPRASIAEQTIKAAVPPGSRFKGYESFVVQELVLRAQVTRYRRERWVTPEGATVVAPLPAGVAGHFGPQLRRFLLVQHHQGQVTVERLVKQLRAIGISISKRQVMRLLIAGQDGFLDEAREVLRAGLQTAAWITVDDTGARHKRGNDVCTQIGNDRFTWFGTTSSKSRRNFLELLRAGYTDYVINTAALNYLRERALAGPVVRMLAEQPERQFADQAAWLAHLERLGITTLTVTPDPVQIATEGALWGSIRAHGLLRDTVVLSDDAGQFAVGRHALCWVHAERPGVRRGGRLHRTASRGATAHPRPDLALLRRAEGVPRQAGGAPAQHPMRPLRPHLWPAHRLRHARPPAQAAARQQSRAADGARSARDTAQHQRFGKRHGRVRQ